MLNKYKNYISILFISIILFGITIDIDKVFIQEASAYTINDKNTFDEYKKKIEMLSTELERDYKVKGKLSTTNLDLLKDYVTKSIDTLPNDDNFISNNSIAKNLLISIDVVKASPGSDNKITELAGNLSQYLNSIKIPRIQATIKASPQSGSAPLTTTLRAENSSDPSGVVIPQANYVWRLKQSDGSRKTIGIGPSINYTFKEEKSYIVNLDIASASRNDKGKIDVLPFAGTIKIDALPSLGNIYLYINGVNASDLDKIKITPNIGKAGLVIDATSSQPVGGSKFVKTTWDFGNSNKASYDSYPRLEKQYYVSEGTYRLSLDILTNESKTISKQLFIDVRDPVASINLDKITGFVGDDFRMGVSTSFYDGKLNYEWKITDLGSDTALYSSNQENFTYKFKKTGKFAVKLKSIAPSGREDTDIKVVTIDSRDPIAVFESNVSSSETPNTYKFDASSSFDPDTYDGSKLTFNWIIDGQKVELENPYRNGSIGKYTFNTEGNHKVMLEVSNKDGKTSSIKKDINITSLLSVKMTFSPKIVKMNSPVVIIAEAKEASVFEWNFGDGVTDLTNNGRMTHSFKKSGAYDILLNLKGKKNGDTNSITRKIYVTDGDSPMADIVLSRESDDIILSPNACDGQDAYLIDRAGVINFSGESSVNIDGNPSGLIYSWKYMNKTSSQAKFSYKFDELGCFPISLTVKSQKNGKLSTIKTFVKVDNLAPRVAGLTVSSTDTNSDPVIVKLTANNPTDADGVITSYLWYYYSDSDPEPQDYRITKTPETTFVLPKVTGKYYFVLILEDSNGVKVNTEDLSDERYSIQLVTDNMNTPIIKLSADKTSISTGDEINFDIKVSDILGKDISDKVEYKYDFDGDGFYDDTSKSGKITHKFTKSGNINFKVKVTNKGISNTKYQMISVKNVLKPNFEYYAVGKKLVLFNTSVGSYTTSSWDLGNNITSTSLHSFSYDFSSGDFPKEATLKVSDGNDTQSITIPVRKDVINQMKVTKSKDKLIVFTYPKLENGIIHITKDDTKAFIYLGSSKGDITNYCIDSDTKVDSDLNGKADDDCDNKGMDSFTSGSPFAISDFDSNFKERNVKVSLITGNKIIEESKFNIILDYINESSSKSIVVKDNSEISENDRKGIEELKTLIKKAPEKDRLKLTQFLSTLQENWFDDREKTKNVIDFESYVSSSSADQSLKDQFFNILEGFLVEQSQTKDEISLAAKVLRTLIPKTNPNYEKIQKNIDEILSHPTNTKLNKELGTFILDSVKSDSNISNKDKVIIKSQLQVIIYGSQKNIPEEVATESKNEVTSSNSSGIVNFMIGIAKWFAYIIFGIILVFIGLFILFKITNKNDNLSFQDFIIDLFLKKGNVKKVDNNQKPQEVKKTEPKQDILNNIGNTNIDSQNVNPSNNLQENITEKKEDVLSKFEPESNQSNTQVETSGIPDWLKGTTSYTDNKLLNNDSNSDAENKESIIENKESDLQTNDTQIPDWLKGNNVSSQESNISSEIIQEANLKDKEIESTEIIDNSQKPTDNSINENNSDSDLPNWLKGNNIEQENSNKDTDIIEDNNQESSQNNNYIENTLKSGGGELPSWLKGIDQNELKNEINTELDLNTDNDDKSESTLNTSSELPSWLKGDSNTNKEPTEVDSIPKTDDKKKQPTKKNKEIFEDVSEQIKSPKPISKKPKILEQKSDDSILNKNNDDLPDWLK